MWRQTRVRVDRTMMESGQGKLRFSFFFYLFVPYQAYFKIALQFKQEITNHFSIIIQTELSKAVEPQRTPGISENFRSITIVLLPTG